jgi:hypothetical protein
MELAEQQNVKLPATNEQKLEKILKIGMNCSSLVEYLRPFDITLSVLQEPEALFRATYELVEDCAAENVRYLEIRFAPILHSQKGMRLHDGGFNGNRKFSSYCTHYSPTFAYYSRNDSGRVRRSIRRKSPLSSPVSVRNNSVFNNIIYQYLRGICIGKK